MILNQSSYGTKYYCFNNLSKLPSLVHGVFTRAGGTSQFSFNSLNVGVSTGDKRENVYLNRELVAKTMGVDKDSTLYLNQVHGRDFLVLKKGEHNNSSENRYRYQQEADGIVTNIKGVLTVMQVADCQAIILYDPVNEVIANIHSGWRGSILNIIGCGVDIMVKDFYTKPSDIIAAISPSLGPCCSEFKNYREEIPERFWKYRISSKDNEHNFDFWKISCDQLTEKGVLKQNIEVAEICTPCTSHLFYSYRKENITGRFPVAVALI